MPYHGIIVAVDHDGPAASKVNILLPPVAHLCKTKVEIKIKIKIEKTERVTLSETPRNKGIGQNPQSETVM